MTVTSWGTKAGTFSRKPNTLCLKTTKMPSSGQNRPNITDTVWTWSKSPNQFIKAATCLSISWLVQVLTTCSGERLDVEFWTRGSEAVLILKSQYDHALLTYWSLIASCCLIHLNVLKVERQKKRKEAFVFISICYAMELQWAPRYIDQSLGAHSFRCGQWCSAVRSHCAHTHC